MPLTADDLAQIGTLLDAKLAPIISDLAQVQKQLKSTDATVKSIQERLKGIEKDTKLLVEANPAAAKIPNVFVAGTKDTAYSTEKRSRGHLDPGQSDEDQSLSSRATAAADERTVC